MADRMPEDQDERIFRIEAGGFGIDAAKPECLHECIADTAVVSGIDVSRNGDEGAQEIAKRDVDGRAVIDGARAELEERARPSADAYPAKSSASGAGRSSFRSLTPSGAVDAKQHIGAVHVNAEESVEHGCDQNRAAEVRIVDVLVDSRRSLAEYRARTAARISLRAPDRTG